MPQCYLCPYTHSLLDNLTSHMLKAHEVTNAELNNNYEATAMGPEGHKCLYCPFTHPDPGTTLAHLRLEHSAEVKRRLHCSARFQAFGDDGDGMSVDIPMLSMFTHLSVYGIYFIF